MATEQSNARESKLNQLKDILFKEELARVEALDEKVTATEKLAQQIDPLLEQHFAELKESFPTEFGPAITKALKTQIKESQEDVIEVLYPIMGRLIKKYVQKEVAKLSESVDAKMRQLFSFKGLLQRLRFGVKGVSQSDAIVQGLLPPVLEQIMVIENDSGLLLANHAVSENSDADMVAGMLTAIKAFVEDAYVKSQQDLEFIEYETFTLYLQSFNSFYVVVAVSGVLDEAFKDKLNDAVLNFAVKITEDQTKNMDEDSMQKLLENHFNQVYNKQAA